MTWKKSLAAWSNMRCKIFKKGCNLNSIRKREIALRWFRDVFKIYELKMRSTLNLFQMHILKEYTEMLCRFLNQELISNRWYMFIFTYFQLLMLRNVEKQCIRIWIIYYTLESTFKIVSFLFQIVQLKFSSLPITEMHILPI